MSNHSHELISYTKSVQFLSWFMRIAHSCFGIYFNKLHNRIGSVGCDRAKTPQVQENAFHQMRVQFYLEANPIRAKMVKNLKLYKFSSFRFYAWGIKDDLTSQLTPPVWYINLGKTEIQRQERYRSLFDKYLRSQPQRLGVFALARYIGDESWCINRESELKDSLEKLRLKVFPPTNI